MLLPLLSQLLLTSPVWTRTILHKIVALSMIGVLFAAPGVVLASSINASDLIVLTNKERVKNGLPELITNHKLTTSAHRKAIDMISSQYFSHTTPTEKPFYEWIEEDGYHYLYAGENLAIDFTTNEATIQAWMDSTTHRANILNENYTDIGLATFRGNWKDHETTIAVQVFGSLLEDAPTVLGQTLENLSKEFGIRKDSLTTLASDLVMLPSLAGNTYFDILVSPKNDAKIVASNQGSSSIATSPITKIVQGPTYRTLLKSQVTCCNQDTEFALTEEKNNVLTSTPITYPSFTRFISTFGGNKLSFYSLPQTTYNNLLLAGLIILLLLFSYQNEIKRELGLIKK